MKKTSQGMGQRTGGRGTLSGGQGNDALNGGIGNDVYVYNPGDGADTIKDGWLHWTKDGELAGDSCDAANDYEYSIQPTRRAA
jgi:hypothetical protein